MDAAPKAWVMEKLWKKKEGRTAIMLMNGVPDYNLAEPDVGVLLNNADSDDVCE